MTYRFVNNSHENVFVIAKDHGAIGVLDADLVSISNLGNEYVCLVFSIVAGDS